MKNNLLIIKLKHSGSVWRKVIRQKYPGAVSNGVRVKEKKKEKGRQSRKDSSAPEGKSELPNLLRFNNLLLQDSGNKFSTTWRPVGDYVHLKIQFLVQDTSLQITGPSYILWANENYAECCKMADQIAAKEAEEEEEEEHDDLDDGQKMDEIIRYIRFSLSN